MTRTRRAIFHRKLFGPARPRDERGVVLIEWILGLVLILLPAVGVGAVAVQWPGRINAAHSAAYEASKAVLVDGDEGAARARAEEVWLSHGYDDPITVDFAGDPADRGGAVTATVSVTLPVIRFPGVGTKGGYSWSTEHVERVPDYRSNP
jgi:hypothetical protein